jgi:transposase
VAVERRTFGRPEPRSYAGSPADEISLSDNALALRRLSTRRHADGSRAAQSTRSALRPASGWLRVLDRPGPRFSLSCTLTGMLVADADGRARSLGDLAEIGVIAPQGVQHAYGLKRLAVDGFDEYGEFVVPDSVRLALAPLVRHIDALDAAIESLDRELEASAKADETARRLMTIPGVGPVTASALLATVQDFGAFSSGREFAAFLGLTPREHSTGGKPRLGRITKMGDRYSHASCWFRARAPRLATAKGITTPCAAGRAECSSARPSSTSSS